MNSASKGISSYVLRHSYASDAIERGVSLPILAELMGTSVRMLLDRYVHLTAKKDALKAAALKALG